ncbi:MAG: hypothetical protein CMJ31_08895 [Phycisphaerae bacterium]|nr:hypothetical protein [Phycisphaerae bacterium]
MEHATITSTTGEIVIPDSEEQCKLMYPPQQLVPLGDFGRSAGYGCPVLMTTEAVRHLFGAEPQLPPLKLAERLIGTLSDIREVSATRPAFDAFRIRKTDDEPELLVRQNLLAARPYTLISLA